MRKKVLHLLCVGMLTCAAIACGDDEPVNDNTQPNQNTENVQNNDQKKNENNEDNKNDGNNNENQQNTSDQTVTQKHEYVDLGLTSGTLWAKENIGAKGCYEYGDYFAWGETQTKESYTFDNYKYKGEKEMMISKYCLSEESGTIDNLLTLLSEDDAAYVLWGKEWTMPTLEQINELFEECDCKWMKDYEESGINGLLVQSKKNANSIFLPAAGLYNKERLDYKNKDCYYATKTVFKFGSDRAWILEATSLGQSHANMNRHNGYSIRPVYAASNK